MPVYWVWMVPRIRIRSDQCMSPHISSDILYQAIYELVPNTYQDTHSLVLVAYGQEVHHKILASFNANGNQTSALCKIIDSSHFRHGGNYRAT